MGTHAFDGTVDPASPVVAGKSFTFHNWCIGEGGSEFNSGNNYLRGRSADGLSFRTMSETMRLLGHDSVDVLKFDIEGFEWKLFDTEILSGKNLPRQLAFELHTEGSVPKAVPPHLVKGKGFAEVNRLPSSLQGDEHLRRQVCGVCACKHQRASGLGEGSLSGALYSRPTEVYRGVVGSRCAEGLSSTRCG